VTARSTAVPPALAAPSTLSANASSDRSSTAAIAATVANAGVGIRPVSILRSVSFEIPEAAETSAIGRGPRASRRAAPRR